MKFHATSIAGLYTIDLEPTYDERGFFARSFCRQEFAMQGLHSDFVQCNISHNDRARTLRGMHYQRPPYEEVKLIRCSAGAIYDVVVDLRTGSKTFGQSFGLELSADSPRMLYVPPGVAHGFLTLRDSTDVCYQMGNYHNPDAAEGFRWNDPAFRISWPELPLIVSDRDSGYEDFIGK